MSHFVWYIFTVHLRVSVEGVVYDEVFEADPNLTYRYAWQRKNAYQQNVYGIVNAHGKIVTYCVVSIISFSV